MSSSSWISPVMVLAVPLILYVPTDGAVRTSDPVQNVSARERLPTASGPDHWLGPTPYDRSDEPKLRGRAVALDLHWTIADHERISSVQMICASGGIAVRSGGRLIVFDHEHHVFDISSWDLDTMQAERVTEANGVTYVSVIASLSSMDGARHAVLSKNISIDFVSGVVKEEDSQGDASIAAGGADLASRLKDDADKKGRGVASVDSDSNVYVDIAPVIPATGQLTEAVGEQPSAVMSKRTEAEERASGISDKVAPRARSEPEGDSAVLVTRARSLISRGDISSARLLLERARTRRSAEAIALLGQTYDPSKLREWNVRGLRPDPDMAQRLYAEADKIGGSDGQLVAATNP